MAELKMFLVGFMALCSIVGLSSAEKIINCYWGSWSSYRPGDGAFAPEHIDPHLCTHLGYSFHGISESGQVKSLDDWLDYNPGKNTIEKVMNLKKVNPKLKVLLVIGGWNEGSVKYSRMAADPKKRKTFIDSSLAYMKKYNFDGLDLDWEYPARREGSPADKQNFVTLLKELYQALTPQYTVSIAVGASPLNADISYDIASIAQYVDFINIMTYDFADAGQGHVGFNAPLSGQGVNNVKDTLSFWLSQAPANKLVLGLAFYGHTFRLANSQQHSLGSPTSGSGKAGPHTAQPGFLGYNEICQQQNSYNYEWTEEGVPILYDSNELISYDDEKSIALKVDLANSLGLAGVMIWSIETDDFNGRCGDKYILLKTINNKMGNTQNILSSGNKKMASQPKIPQRMPSSRKKVVSQPKIPQLSQPNPPKQAEGSGICAGKTGDLFAHESNCAQFIHCADGVAYEKSCPENLYFNAAAKACDWPENVNCKN